MKKNKLLAGLLSLAMVSSMIPTTFVSAATATNTVPKQDGYVFYEDFEDDDYYNTFDVLTNQTRWSNEVVDGRMVYTIDPTNTTDKNMWTAAGIYGLTANKFYELQYTINISGLTDDVTLNAVPIALGVNGGAKIINSANPTFTVGSNAAVEFKKSDDVTIRVQGLGKDSSYRRVYMTYTAADGTAVADELYEISACNHAGNQIIKAVSTTDTAGSGSFYIDNVYAKQLTGYTVTFKDGSDGGVVTVSGLSAGSDGYYTDEAMFGVLSKGTLSGVKSGYEFLGWYYDQDYTNAYVDGAAPDEDFTLYAKFEKAYTVSFNSNGGSAITAVPTSSGYINPMSVSTPSLSGKYFMGWYTDENLTSAWDGTVSADMTVYAKWSDLIFEEHFDDYTYSTAFKSPNTSRWTEAVTDGRLVYTINPSASAANFWVTNACPTGTMPNTNGTLYEFGYTLNLADLTANISIFATPGHYSKGLKIMYDTSSQGFVLTGAGLTSNVPVNKDYDITFRMMYDHTGTTVWYTVNYTDMSGVAQELETMLYDTSMTYRQVIMNGGNSKLTNESGSFWIDDMYVKYATETTVTYKAADGSVIDVDGVENEEGVYDTARVFNGYLLGGIPKLSDSEDGVFLGWFDADGNKVVNGTLTEDCDLFAKYAAGNVICFNANGGSEVDTIVTVGTEITLPEAPTRALCTFSGWYKDTACSEKLGDAGDVIALSALEFDAALTTTVYAGWIVPDGIVTFMNGEEVYTQVATNDDDVVEDIPTIASTSTQYFMGWYTADGEGWDGKAEESMTVYAKWYDGVLYEDFETTSYYSKFAAESTQTVWSNEIVEKNGSKMMMYTINPSGTTHNNRYVWYNQNWELLGSSSTPPIVANEYYEMGYTLDLSEIGTNDISLQLMRLNVGGSPTIKNGYFTAKDFENTSTNTTVYFDTAYPITVKVVGKAERANVTNEYATAYVTYTDTSGVRHTGEKYAVQGRDTSTSIFLNGSVSTTMTEGSFYIDNAYVKTAETFTVSYVDTDGTSLGIEDGTAVAGYVSGGAPTPTKDYYIFDGWYTADGAEFVNGEVYAETTLYAQWKEAYTIAFDTDGGSDVTSIVTTEDTITLPDAPTKGISTFIGWYADSDLETKLGNAATELALSKLTFDASRTATVYAGWESPDAVVTFMNGETVVNQIGTENGRIEPENFPVLTETGKYFQGWYTADGTAWNGKTDVDMTVYAKWSDNLIDENFDAYTHGAFFDITYGDQTRWSGEVVDGRMKYTIDPDGTASSDKRLWATNLQLTGGTVNKYYELGYTIDLSELSSDANFYFKPSFDVNGGPQINNGNFTVPGINGSFAFDKSYPVTVRVKGQAVKGTLKTAYITYKNTSGEIVTDEVYGIYNQGTTSTQFLWNVGEGNVTGTGSFYLDNVYVRQIPEYAVSYKNVDGTDATLRNGASATGLAVEGKIVGGVPDAKIEGKAFAGWYYDAELTNAYVDGEAPEEAFTLYAGFTDGAATITFDTDDGSAIETEYALAGTKIDLSKISKPTKTDYYFMGWYDEDGEAWDGTVTGDMTIYAKWSSYLIYENFTAYTHNTILDIQEAAQPRWTNEIVEKDGNRAMKYTGDASISSLYTSYFTTNTLVMTVPTGEWELGYKLDFSEVTGATFSNFSLLYGLNGGPTFTKSNFTVPSNGTYTYDKAYPITVRIVGVNTDTARDVYISYTDTDGTSYENRYFAVTSTAAQNQLLLNGSATTTIGTGTDSFYLDNLYLREPVTTIAATFMDSDGTVLATKDIEYGRLEIADVLPTKEGYTLIGWADSANATEAQYTTYATFEDLDDDMTFYAVWYGETYVSFVNGETVEYAGYTTMGKITPPADVENADENVFFKGWYYNGEAVTADTEFTGETATAVAEFGEKYTISFYKDSSMETLIADVDCTIGNVPTPDAPIDLAVGYFAGWYYTDGETEYALDANAITNGMKVYAKWSSVLYSENFDGSSYDSAWNTPVDSQQRWTSAVNLDGEMVYSVNTPVPLTTTNKYVFATKDFGTSLPVDVNYAYEYTYSIDVRPNDITDNELLTNDILFGLNIDVGTGTPITIGGLKFMTRGGYATNVAVLNGRSYLHANTELDENGNFVSALPYYSDAVDGWITFKVRFCLAEGKYTMVTTYKTTSGIMMEQTDTGTFTLPTGLETAYITGITAFSDASTSPTEYGEAMKIDNISIVKAGEAIPVVYDMGTSGLEAPESTTALYGDIANLATIDDADWYFDGWFYDTAFTEPYASGTATADNAVDGTITLYAKLQRGYYVDFYYDNTSFDEANRYASVKTRSGELVDMPTNPIDFDRGYVSKWLVNSTDAKFDANAPITSYVQVYAIWDENVLYSENFDNASDYDSIWNTPTVDDQRWTSEITSDGAMTYTLDASAALSDTNSTVYAQKTFGENLPLEVGQAYEFSFMVDAYPDKSIENGVGSSKAMMTVMMKKGNSQFEVGKMNLANAWNRCSDIQLAGNYLRMDADLDADGNYINANARRSDMVDGFIYYKVRFDLSQGKYQMLARYTDIDGVERVQVEEATLAVPEGEDTVYITGLGQFVDNAANAITGTSFKIDEIELRKVTGEDPILSFDSNGAGRIASVTADFAGRVTMPTDPTLEGYGFAGWYTNEDWTEKFDGYVDKDMTVYARWQETPTVSSITPADGTEISLTPEFVVYFDSEMNEESVLEAIELRNGSKIISSETYEVTISYTSTFETVATIKVIGALESGTAYTLAVKKTASNFKGEMAEEYTATYTTKDLMLDIQNETVTVDGSAFTTFEAAAGKQMSITFDIYNVWNDIN